MTYRVQSDRRAELLEFHLQGGIELLQRSEQSAEQIPDADSELSCHGGDGDVLAGFAQAKLPAPGVQGAVGLLQRVLGGLDEHGAKISAAKRHQSPASADGFSALLDAGSEAKISDEFFGVREASDVPDDRRNG